MTEINETFEYENAWHREWCVMQLEIQKLNKAILRRNHKHWILKQKNKFLKDVMREVLTDSQKDVMYKYKPLSEYLND